VKITKEGIATHSLAQSTLRVEGACYGSRMGNMTNDK